MKSLNGQYCSAIGVAHSARTIQLYCEVFLEENMMSDENRTKLMKTLYLGGGAQATCYAGVCHTFSAWRSEALGHHHGVDKCITMYGRNVFMDRGRRAW